MLDQPGGGPSARPLDYFDRVWQLLFYLRRMRYDQDLAKTASESLESEQHAVPAFFVEGTEYLVQYQQAHGAA
jgi:hypothetical protein